MIGVIVFDLFHYSSMYGIVEINSINSLLMVPFILLVCWLGMKICEEKQIQAIENSFKNQLSDREKQVLDLISSGRKNREIAELLFVDISTVKTHVNNIYKKTGLKNRNELKYYGVEVLENRKKH